MLTTHTPAHRRSVGLIGMLALLLSMLVGAGAATAAPPYTTEATVTAADFTQETIASGSHAELNIAWELPDNPSAPVGLLVDLPPELQGRTDAFPLLAGDGVELAQCTVTATQVYCDFDEAYLAENPLNISGNLSFWVEIGTEVTEETEVTYDIEGIEGTITVTPPPSGTCTESCEFTGRGSNKWGTYDRDADTIAWRVVVKAPTEGMTGDQEVTVSDRVGPAQEITSVRVRQTNLLVTDAKGRQAPGNYTVLDPSRYTISDDLSTVVLTSEQGYFYVVDYVTAVTDGGASQTYTNEADITIAGETTRTVAGEVIRQGGGGSGSGTDVGTFTITKDVVGAADAAAGVTFTGTYEVTTPAGDVLPGSFELLDGDTWVSGEFPRGSIVHLTEVTPTGPENVAWAAPAFSENDFTLGSGSTTAVTLTNEATLLSGAFSVTKVVAGDGAAQVAGDATFVVAYSYPDGPGFEAGTGELIVSADGTVAESEQLPAGAVVTLTEVTLDPVEGLTWGEPVFSDRTVTVAAGEIVAVELTNTATLVPPTPAPTETPVDVATTPLPAPALPDTGADVSGGALIGALALIMVGATMLAMRRRRQY